MANDQNVRGNTHSVLGNDAAALVAHESNAFEGPEKLLEIWFSPSETTLPASTRIGGLKAVPRENWEDMLDLVNCRILSVMTSAPFDAYLLSESSMFVFPHKFIIKTCGTTTLLRGLACILEIAASHAGFPVEVADSQSSKQFASTHRVFYSRRSFLFPDRQHEPHRSWEDEVGCLDQYFANGSSHFIGSMSKDPWHLYLTQPTMPRVDSPELTTEHCKPQSAEHLSDHGDETLEILMTGLSPERMRIFHRSEASALIKVPLPSDHPQASGIAFGQCVASHLGLTSLFPEEGKCKAVIDTYVFDPCGFSANGIVRIGDDGSSYYYTIHVTPEAECSYASFETNVPIKHMTGNSVDLVSQVIQMFDPESYSMTIFNSTCKHIEWRPDKGASAPAISATAEYKRVESTLHDLHGYELCYQHFERITVC